MALFFILAIVKNAPLRPFMQAAVNWLLVKGEVSIPGGLLRCAILMLCFNVHWLTRPMWSLLRQRMTGFWTVSLFVLLPYALCGLRIYWSISRARRFPRSSDESNSPGPHPPALS